jgi:tetratricopeptide (TPR) repeat protein
MSARRVSVAMPVYNSDPVRFRAALDALLQQSYGDFELVLSDNGSHEEARTLYEDAAKLDPRIRYIRHNHNYGAVLNFNYSFAQTSGEYFMWTADDDIRGKDYLLRTVERLDRDAAAVTAGTDVVLVDDKGTRINKVVFPAEFALPRPHQRLPVRAFVSQGDYFDIYSLHRRSALLRTHVASAIHGGDCLLVRELLLQGPITRVDEELFFYRVPSSYSMESLAKAVLGEQGKSFLFRDPTTYLALQMLLAVATNDVPISDLERARTLVALASSLLRHGWLTLDPQLRSRSEALKAWRTGDHARAALFLAKALALSPAMPFDVAAWRRLGKRFVDPPAPAS